MRLAIQKGYNVFGLQYYGECWAGSFSKYDLLKKTTSTCENLGISWANQVYVKPYQYKGCYKDNSSRMIPNLLGNVSSVSACKLLAYANKYDTFGV
jgi:hypothetical protein